MNIWKSNKIDFAWLVDNLLLLEEYRERIVVNLRVTLREYESICKFGDVSMGCSTIGYELDTAYSSWNILGIYSVQLDKSDTFLYFPYCIQHCYFWTVYHYYIITQ
jgi:hypothetical protein